MDIISRHPRSVIAVDPLNSAFVDWLYKLAVNEEPCIKSNGSFVSGCVEVVGVCGRHGDEFLLSLFTPNI